MHNAAIDFLGPVASKIEMVAEIYEKNFHLLSSGCTGTLNSLTALIAKIQIKLLNYNVPIKLATLQNT
jgi:hypothetical protein